MRRNDPVDLKCVIEVLVPNPKKPGSRAFVRFELYKTGQTVDDFLKAGGQRVDVNWDLDHDFIRCHQPGTRLRRR